MGLLLPFIEQIYHCLSSFKKLNLILFFSLRSLDFFFQELTSQKYLPLAFVIYHLYVLDLRYFSDLLSDVFCFFLLVAHILSDY